MAPAADLAGLKEGEKLQLQPNGSGLLCEEAQPENEYVLTDPHSGHGIFHYIVSIFLQRHKGMSYSDKIEAVHAGDKTWQAQLSVIFLKLLFRIYAPMKVFGHMVEDTLNLFVANGGIFMTFYRMFFFWNWGDLKIYDRDHALYASFLGLLDPRKELYTTSAPSSDKINQANELVFPGTEYGSKFTADVCVMASKLAYENGNHVERVVGKFWKMNFIGFYDCWNEFQQEKNTQVFIFTDRQVDARAVVVAWRGTEPFNTLDWSTDFDFSYMDINGLGKVHVGFLEALGLVSRTNTKTFTKLQKHIDQNKDENNAESDLSGLSKEVRQDKYKKLAYDEVTTKVKWLLRKHSNAKLFITGHSLGGALANLYSGLLFFNNEDDVTSKIAAVYTFGQPRVGNYDYSQYLINKLTPSKYWRVVYSSDLVPRIPFDGPLFQFKHSGYCHYYDERKTLWTLKDVPNPNYFSTKISFYIETRIGAMYDLILSLFSGWIYGPEFRENWIALATRCLGIITPGMCGHLLNNYVSAVRLGPPILETRLHEQPSYGLVNWFLSFLGSRKQKYPTSAAYHS